MWVAAAQFHTPRCGVSLGAVSSSYIKASASKHTIATHPPSSVTCHCTRIAQATSLWRQTNYADTCATSRGLDLIRVNLDETAVCLFPGRGKGAVFLSRADIAAGAGQKGGKVETTELYDACRGALRQAWPPEGTPAIYHCESENAPCPRDACSVEACATKRDTDTPTVCVEQCSAHCASYSDGGGGSCGGIGHRHAIQDSILHGRSSHTPCRSCMARVPPSRRMAQHRTAADHVAPTAVGHTCFRAL